jgi:hypothetical protein
METVKKEELTEEQKLAKIIEEKSQKNLKEASDKIGEILNQHNLEFNHSIEISSTGQIFPKIMLVNKKN